MSDYQQVLEFWFKETRPERRFAKDPALDQEIRRRFFNLRLQAERGELYKWRQSAEGALAEIVLLDQFSRNIFRDTAKAFASDPQALVLAQEAVGKEQDKELEAEKKAFLYMPYMHSESLIIHQEAMKLFSQEGLGLGLDYEIQHKNIIEKFGRYPHRNKILGRVSSPEEEDFLAQPNSSF